MVGALNTTTGSPVPLEKFTQDGDTFYLTTPVAGSNPILPPPTATPILISSVPSGISVEAFGRCVATSTTPATFVIVYPPSTSPGSPVSFPAVPGYAFQTTISGMSPPPQIATAYPYRIYTNTSRSFSAQATAASQLYCMNDGWVWHRAG
jgi:hypothetical protein